MTPCCYLLQVLASIDHTPPLEPPMPAVEQLPAIAASHGSKDGHKPLTPEEVLKELEHMAEEENELGQEIKVSMQSHYE